MFEWWASPEAWIALGTLTTLEIVLGIDNIIFISILCSGHTVSKNAWLPEEFDMQRFIASYCRDKLGE